MRNRGFAIFIEGVGVGLARLIVSVGAEVLQIGHTAIRC
jgi:hypothetical protein